MIMRQRERDSTRERERKRVGEEKQPRETEQGGLNAKRGKMKEEGGVFKNKQFLYSIYKILMQLPPLKI